jgi:hypothetical protein
MCFSLVLGPNGKVAPQALVDGCRTTEVLNWSQQDSYECLPLDFDKDFLCGRFGTSPNQDSEDAMAVSSRAFRLSRLSRSLGITASLTRRNQSSVRSRQGDLRTQLACPLSV